MAPLMADMAHPNNDGHKLIAEKIAKYLSGK
jgi:lysophospholipase L1-like esterase